MDLPERRLKVLIVSSQPKFNESLLKLTAERRRFSCTLETGAGSAKRRLNEMRFDIIIINMPLSDDDGVRFAIDRCSGSESAVMLIVRNDSYAEVFAKVCPYGVFTLPKPSSTQMVMQAFDWLECSAERMSRMRKSTVSLEEKMAEIRLVNRAKWLLISEQGMTEEQAHRFIEKQAMDKCVTKRRIAEEILSK